MSFILDALRKSENSRLRQDHPAIFAARVNAQRPRRPRWVAVIGALLIVNLLVVAYALWQQQDAVSATTSVDSVAQRGPTEIEPAAPVATAIPPLAAGPSAEPTAGPTSGPAVMPASISAASTSVTPRSPAAAIEPRVTRDDLLARGTAVPAVDLNLHVYDPNQAARFVLLNGQRLREGEMSREGLRVERITPQGVVLNHAGSSFAVNLQ